MRPFFFGSSNRQLYGAYHPASDDADARSTAAVLAYPWMAEYNMSHWAFRKLAGMLAREGFPTLRFDYFGTGDSMGSAGEAGCADWIADIGTASRELLELSGLTHVTLVGKGLGALLALQAADGLPVRDLILWDPVLSGDSYLRELDKIDESQRLYRLYPSAMGARDELLGFELPRKERAALAKLDARSTLPSVEGRSVLVAGQQRAEYQELVTLLSSAGRRASLELAEEDSASAAVAAEGQTALLSIKPLTVITSALLAGEPS